MALKCGLIVVSASLTPYLSGYKHLDDFNELCSTWLCYHPVFADQLMHKFVQGGEEAGAAESRICNVTVGSPWKCLEKAGFESFSVPWKRVDSTENLHSEDVGDPRPASEILEGSMLCNPPNRFHSQYHHQVNWHSCCR